MGYLSLDTSTLSTDYIRALASGRPAHFDAQIQQYPDNDFRGSFRNLAGGDIAICSRRYFVFLDKFLICDLGIRADGFPTHPQLVFYKKRHRFKTAKAVRHLQIPRNPKMSRHRRSFQFLRCPGIIILTQTQIRDMLSITPRPTPDFSPGIPHRSGVDMRLN